MIRATRLSHRAAAHASAYHPRRLGIAVLVALLSAGLYSCGGNCRVFLSGGLAIDCGDVPPGPSDPAFGTEAEVLVEDTPVSKRLWIGVNDATVFSTFQTLCAQGRLEWIGGRVVVATDHPLDFFFDPDEIIVATSAPAAIQTTLDQIRTDPEFFTPTGEGGTPEWVVPATVLDVESPDSMQCRPATPSPRE